LLPPRADADGTHRRLLEGALVKFSDRGFHGVSVREVAQAAGIRASSMYAHLESKEQLLAELMLLGHEEHHESLRLALLEASADPCDQIVQLVGANVRFHAEYSLLARVCNRELAALAPESRERVLAVRVQSERLFLDVIERGVQRGVFDVANPHLGVAAIGAMGIRIAEWWDTRPEYRTTVDDLVTMYAAFAVRLLGGAA
jgi:AcrR family transcriptional regulator